MQILQVDLGDRSYPIYIGQDLLNEKELVRQHIPGKRVMVISNQTVWPIYKDKIETALHGIDYRVTILADGEKHKNLDSLNQIYTALLDANYDRNSTLIAVGGGVIGDITGFAAASFLRGIHFIQIPTTLLAQVDSSVGGKTAVNHPLGKNMIGAFYQPRCVIADTTTLNSLPDRELSAGIAEVIKYGLIKEANFLTWLENNIEKLLQRDHGALAYAIEHSCQLKADIVAQDEHEKNIRAILNLGHTYGHAIETFVKYEGWLHGEAVAAGMLMAAQVSQRCGWLSEQDVTRIETLLHKTKLPTSPPDNMSAEAFIKLMARDKKVIDSELRLVLLKSIGHAIVSSEHQEHMLKHLQETRQT